VYPHHPTTVNLKTVELLVKQIVSGRTIKPSGTLLNPESLDYYYQFGKIEDVVREREREVRVSCRLIERERAREERKEREKTKTHTHIYTYIHTPHKYINI
jgi:hypothetical protein